MPGTGGLSPCSRHEGLLRRGKSLGHRLRSHLQRRRRGAVDGDWYSGMWLRTRGWRVRVCRRTFSLIGRRVVTNVVSSVAI